MRITIEFDIDAERGMRPEIMRRGVEGVVEMALRYCGTPAVLKEFQDWAASVTAIEHSSAPPQLLALQRTGWAAADPAYVASSMRHTASERTW